MAPEGIGRAGPRYATGGCAVTHGLVDVVLMVVTAASFVAAVASGMALWRARRRLHDEQ